MSGSALAWTAFALAAVPALLFLRNLSQYRLLPSLDVAGPPPLPAVSILIPARNESAAIVDCVLAAAASRNVHWEVVVLDDHSSDNTYELVAALAQQDMRIRVERAPALPVGWCGKQHACAQLARLARHPFLVFLDADVRLSPDALARMVWYLDRSGADLISGVPRQRTSGPLDGLLIPLIHFLLLGFLPLGAMRRTRWPALSAGCGQLFLARREAYDRAGGHTALRRSLHDGIQLPRVFRRAGLATDLFDATDLANCQMYRTNGDTWRGLAKNAVEGLAAPSLILLTTALLAGGQILPFVLLCCGLGDTSSARPPVVAACLMAYLPRLIGVRRFHQPLISALLHPLGILVFLILQWYAFALWLLGRPAGWKGREYTAT